MVSAESGRKLAPCTRTPQPLSPPMNKDSFLARLAIATAISSQMVAGAWADETAATALASTTGAASSAQASPLFSRAPYLQLSTPDSMFIVWRTSQSMDAAVKFGRQMDALDQSSASIKIRQTVADKRQREAFLSTRHRQVPSNTKQNSPDSIQTRYTTTRSTTARRGSPPKMRATTCRETPDRQRSRCLLLGGRRLRHRWEGAGGCPPGDDRPQPQSRARPRSLLARRRHGLWLWHGRRI